ncbi:hypothetical protein F511_18162 [Dorcoceras hygrometricum]|uniref:Uncharacterized protein n=1 Tax=Dorcoceras hygrometricum TaxID=472368 RepID=A0A2Z7BMF5_9LAMI|nr:hypothetical protein F511_18162 [Dorcoceras hygrometricum]
MNSAEERDVEDMKMRRSETTRYCSLVASATQEELLVAEILLGLESVIPLARFNWGFRKKRSCLDAAPPAPPSFQIVEEDIEVRRPLVEAEKEDATAAATATTSPATPLSFSPSESDEKSRRSSKNNSKKRSTAEFIDMIEELTEHGDLLRVKVENARKQYNELKSLNSDLKAMKQVALKTRQIEEGPQREMGRFLNLGMDFIQRDETIMVPHRQPFVADQTAYKIHDCFGPIITQTYSPTNGLDSVNSVGPSGIPDLNLTAEEAFEVDSIQPFDVNREIADRRARFAEARRMRRGIIKIKSMRSACGIKLPRI